GFSFPNSVWERRLGNSVSRNGVSGKRFPNRVWQPGFLRSRSFRLCLMASIRGPAAADVKALPRGKTRLRAGEEVNEGRHLLRPPGSADGDARNHVIDGRLWNAFKNGRGNDCRGDGIDHNVALAGHLLGKRFGQSNETRLAGGVGAQSGVPFLAGDGGHV